MGCASTIYEPRRIVVDKPVDEFGQLGISAARLVLTRFKQCWSPALLSLGHLRTTAVRVVYSRAVIPPTERRSSNLPVLPVMVSAAVVFALTLIVGRAVLSSRVSTESLLEPQAHSGERIPGGSDNVPPAAGDVTYTIKPGDTLSGVAATHGTTIESVVALNGLRNADAIFVGQTLTVRSVPRREGPAVRVIPNGSFVLGPEAVGFDVEAFLAGQPAASRLRQYTELVDGEMLDGPAIVERVSREFSINPRVLLAFMESRSGWVSGNQPAESAAADYAAGLVDPGRAELWLQVNWLSDRLNGGYYDWKTRADRSLTLADGTRLAGHASLGPGSFAIHRALALQSTEAELGVRLQAFADAYRSLFGDPWRDGGKGVDLSFIEFPELQLPFEPKDTWWLTGGPHGGWGDGSAWASLDFVPAEEARGCFISSRWATAVADGVVVEGGAGQVWLDLDGDERRETGPVMLYLHLAEEGRVKPGTRVKAGDRLGRPSCEGGFSNATHLHLARLYDGEWLAAAGEAPFQLGSWTAFGSPTVYDGGLDGARGAQREACECRLEGHNDLVR